MTILRGAMGLAGAALALAIGLAAPALAAADARAELAALIRSYDELERAADPVGAGLDGDPQALRLWPDNSPSAVAERKARLEAFRERLKGLQGEGLKDEDELNRAFLAWLIDDLLEGMAFDQERIAFSSDSGPFGLPGYVARSTAIGSAEAAQAWLDRLAALPAFYEREMANARRGIATGFVLPRPVVEHLLVQVRAQVAEPPEDSPLLSPLKELPPSIPPARQAELRRRALAIVAQEIKPRERAYLELIEREYLPSARTVLGARSLPDGERYYAWLVRHYATQDLTPDEVHRIGLQEVARIRARMEAVMAETGYRGSFEQFLAFLRSDPRFYATSRLQLREKASEIAKRADYALPRFFGLLPRLPYGVVEVPREIEADYTTGRYYPGSPEQGLAAGFLINTSQLDQRPLYELPALTLHEAVPGHHLQIALAQELESLPFFRRNSGPTAFVEGWGLYAESLGEEMGVYRDAYERFGRLSYEMWRACRLVADTGIHWLGWSRDRARECFTRNSALSAKNIEVELDRYVSWPGQAVAYKLGELKLQDLRRRAQARLGDRFDLRRFHDEMLGAGALPLGLLERRIDAWIAAEAAAAP